MADIEALRAVLDELANGYNDCAHRGVMERALAELAALRAERDALLDAINRADAALSDESLEDYGQNAAACVALAAVYDDAGRLARARHVAALGRVAAAAASHIDARDREECHCTNTLNSRKGTDYHAEQKALWHRAQDDQDEIEQEMRDALAALKARGDHG